MHVIRCTDGKYYYEKKLDRYFQHKKYSAAKHKAVKILLHIEKNPGCTEFALKTHFVKQNKDDDSNSGSMCEKTFHKYLNELSAQ